MPNKSLSLFEKFNFSTLFWIALLLMKSAISCGQSLNGKAIFTIHLKTKQPVINIASLVALNTTAMQNRIWKNSDFSTVNSLPALEVSVVENTEDRMMANQGVIETKPFRLRAYPNPVEGSINLLLSDQLFDGQAIMERSLNNCRVCPF